jgi:hypothetical protein
MENFVLPMIVHEKATMVGCNVPWFHAFKHYLALVLFPVEAEDSLVPIICNEQTPAEHSCVGWISEQLL